MFAEKILDEKSVSALQSKLTAEDVRYLNDYRRSVKGMDAESLQQELQKFPGRPFSLKNLAWITFVGDRGFKDYLYDDLHRQAVLKEIESRAQKAGNTAPAPQKYRPSPAPC